MVGDVNVDVARCTERGGQSFWESEIHIVGLGLIEKSICGKCRRTTYALYLHCLNVSR
jgi:hypothetical protein